MRNILIIFAAMLGFGAFAQTNIPTRQMLADTNGVVKWPTNITRIRIGGTDYTNLLGFGLSVTNGQLSVDTTQLPAGGGGGGGSGTVTSVGASTTVSGLGFSGSPVTTTGTLSLTGTVAVASGGTGATDASGARSALSLVPGTDVQTYDSDLAAVAALANAGIIVRTGAGTVAARTITGDSEAVVSNGDGVSGNPTLSIGSSIARDAEVSAAYQPLDSDLTAVAGVSATGLIARTGSGTASARTITGDSEAVVSNGDGVSGNPTLSIGSAIARDAEVAAGYQPLDSDLTAMAAGTAVATPQTNAVSMGAPTLYVGSTNVAAAIAAITSGGEVNTASNLGTPSATIQGLYDSKSVADLRFRSIEAGSGITLTSNANTVAISSTGGAWDGTPIASGTITNLQSDSVTLRGKRLLNVQNGDVWSEGSFNGVGVLYGFYPYVWTALASGAPIALNAETNHPWIETVQSSASANSGGCFTMGTTSFLLGGNEVSLHIVNVRNTNSVVIRDGFLDSVTTSEPVDGAYLEIANGYLFGRTASNSSRTSTVTSNQVALATWYALEVEINASASAAIFRQYNDSGTLLWSATNSVNIPTGSGRVTGNGIIGYYTTGGSQDLYSVDALGIFFNRELNRYP
ncbi:MAG: hypothetical protein E6Q97_18235 [Desulfurellales bacterium]|nr:MAG: hypothetical protein E6Q97_18235 [Desulfurellales bacterium]